MEKDETSRKYLEHLKSQRDERTQALRTVRERFLRLHNRFPSKKEEDLFISRQPQFGDPEYGKGEEAGLEEPPIAPEDLLPIGTAAKAIGAGVTLLAGQMALRKGATKAPQIAGKQRGWIGSRQSNISKEEYKNYSKASTMMNTGEDADKVFKETGWFEFAPGERRYVDFDFVDELAAGPLAKETRAGTKVVSPTGALYKHAGGGRIQQRDVPFESESTIASASPSSRIVNKNTRYKDQDRFDKEQVLGHEIQHVIQRHQGVPGGASMKDISEKYEGSKLLKARIYQHKLGEVEARTVQGYRMMAKDMLDKGMSPEKVKDSLRKVTPIKALHGYEDKAGMVPTDTSLIWSNEQQVLKKFPTKKSSTPNEDIKNVFGWTKED